MSEIIPVPPELLNDKDLFKKFGDELKKKAFHPTKETLKKGDEVYVIKGYHDECEELVSSDSKVFYPAIVIRSESRSSCDVQVKFASGREWWINKNGLVVYESTLHDVLARLVKPKEIELEHLDKLVLDAPAKTEIMNVLKQHHHMQRIFEEWGLNEIMEYGKSMSLLFYGPPGTGKTWAATCIAKSLGKEVLSISAAEIQTSEPGGANRNIQQAFMQAKLRGHVLFLDECDGLITDRSHVGMILAGEINTLLTELERFEGVVIFATNRADTLDPAMARRISLMVEFTNPDKKTRKDIWKVLLPKKMPLAKDVSIAKLAEFELTGGYIKNAILGAARTAAAEEADAVTMKHFAGAIKRIKATKDIMGTHTSRQQDFIKARG